MATQKEYHVYGPPGTGKTTWLKNQIEQVLETHSPEEVLVVSFTRAAAREIVSRGLPLPEQNVGTLHAICFRLLDRPNIAEMNIKDFAEKYPQFALTQKRVGNMNLEDDGAVESDGSDVHILSQMQTLRAKCIPEEEWPYEVKNFWAKWNQWKCWNNFMDFSDLIDVVLQTNMGPPPGIRCCFVDEAQDFTALEFKLIRKWTENLDWVVMVGDDDQSIYGFKGADPRAFIEVDLPPENRTVLDRSYRLPSEILDYATSWIEQVSSRVDKPYEPNEDGGKVLRSMYTHKQPDQLYRDIREDVNAGLSVMVLTSCSYLLDPIKHYLLDVGEMFHNPYRMRRGDWNPVQRRKKDGTTAVERLESLIYDMKVDKDPEVEAWRKMTRANLGYSESQPLWHPEELRAFMGPIGLRQSLKNGGKKFLDEVRLPHESHPLYGRKDVVMEFLLHWAKDVFLNALYADYMGGEPKEYFEFLRPSSAPPMEKLRKIIEKNGFAKALSQPKIIIGTIHSVKGGEADSVYLFPDVSPESMRASMNDDRAADDLIRLYYVGITRARRKVTLCSPTSHYSVRWI